MVQRIVKILDVIKNDDNTNRFFIEVDEVKQNLTLNDNECDTQINLEVALLSKLKQRSFIGTTVTIDY